MPISFSQRDALKQRYYPRADDRSFGFVHQGLRRHLQPRSSVLDAGSGMGTWILKGYQAHIRTLVGVDMVLPAEGMANTGVEGIRPVLADLEAIPLATEAFDIILCYNVIEHLAEPDVVFVEFARLLKRGGALIFKTPALYSSSMVLSRLLPHRTHEVYKQRMGIPADDVFPTHYRCNTTARLDGALQDAGLERETLVTVDQTYDYFVFSSASFVLGLYYSRLTHLPGLRWLHNAIVGIYVKP